MGDPATHPCIPVQSSRWDGQTFLCIDTEREGCNFTNLCFYFTRKRWPCWGMRQDRPHTSLHSHQYWSICKMPPFSHWRQCNLNKVLCFCFYHLSSWPGVLCLLHHLMSCTLLNIQIFVTSLGNLVTAPHLICLPISIRRTMLRGQKCLDKQHPGSICNANINRTQQHSDHFHIQDLVSSNLQLPFL